MTEEAVVQRLTKEQSSSTSYFFSLPHTGPITTWIGCKCQIVISGKLQKLLGGDPPFLMFEMCVCVWGVKPTEALRCPIFLRGSDTICPLYPSVSDLNILFLKSTVNARTSFPHAVLSIVRGRFLLLLYLTVCTPLLYFTCLHKSFSLSSTQKCHPGSVYRFTP